MPPTLYHHLHQGQGGIFTLPFAPSVNAIGTSGCRTCVGVYIPISKTQRFAAHIMAFDYKFRRKDDLAGCWCPTTSEGQKLTSFILNYLQNTPALANLPKDPESVARRRDDSILLCPRINFEGRTATGTYILAALRQHFNLGADFPLTSAHGFGKNHVTNDTCLLRWDGYDHITEEQFDTGSLNPDEQLLETIGWFQRAACEGGQVPKTLEGYSEYWKRVAENEAAGVKRTATDWSITLHEGQWKVVRDGPG